MKTPVAPSTSTSNQEDKASEKKRDKSNENSLRKADTVKKDKDMLSIKSPSLIKYKAGSPTQKANQRTVIMKTDQSMKQTGTTGNEEPKRTSIEVRSYEEDEDFNYDRFRGPPPDQRKPWALRSRGRGRGRGRPWASRGDRDIDARKEQVPQSYYSQAGVSQAEGYLSVEDTDGKTTFYHYTKEEEEERQKKRDSKNRKRTDSLESTSSSDDKSLKKCFKQNSSFDEEALSIKSPKVSSTSSSESGSDKVKQMTLLEKVNEIIKSCVKMKEEKLMSNTALDKTNMIIRKAQEKEQRLLGKTKQGKNTPCADHKFQMDREEGELNEDSDDNSKSGKEETHMISKNNNYRKVTVFSSRKDQMSGKQQKVGLSKLPSQSPTPPSVCELSGKSKSYSRSRSKSRSRSRSPRRSRSSKRHCSSSRSPSYTRRGGNGGYFNTRSSRSRTPPRYFRDKRSRNNWIAVSPCTLQEGVTLHRGAQTRLRVAPKGEFSFPENQNCLVRVTKWTGRDSISNVKIKPQLVTLGDTPDLEIEVEGEGQLQRYDKVACLSILAAQIPSGLFTSAAARRLDWTDRSDNMDRRWFRVTTVVLHKKGEVSYRALPLAMLWMWPPVYICLDQTDSNSSLYFYLLVSLYPSKF